MPEHIVSIIIYSIILFVLLGLMFYVQKVLKAKLSKTAQTPIDYLLSFKKLHSEGKITPEEFRIIKEIVVRGRSSEAEKSQSG